jgi:type I restriction enzyme S subunit
MTEELQPYLTYRDSGMPWLPQVPHHWTVSRAKRLFAARKELAGADDVQLSATQAYGVIPQAEFERRVGRRVVRISMHLEKRRRVELNDFVISMRSFQGGLERAWASGAIRSSYVVLKPEPDVEIGYFAHLFKSAGYIRALQSTANFIRDGQDLNFGNFSAIDLPLPPRDEQVAIARFLDHVKRRIDRFILAKKKLIALLNEQQQAIIHRAVTRGLDPNVPMKDSGVAWLGEIPAHWDTRRVAACIVDRRAGIWGEEPTPQNVDDHIVCIRVADFSMNNLGVRDSRLTLRAIPKTARLPRLLAPGDILLEKSGGGEAEPVGRVVMFDLPVPAVCSNFISRLRPNPDVVETRFLLLALSSMQATRRNVPFIKQTTGIQNLSERAYLTLQIALPTIDEQRSISTQVRDRTEALRAQVDLAEREIALIREYRTRLIVDVVTGQIDVRTAAGSLPDVDPDVEPDVVPETDADGSLNEGDDENLDTGEAA